MFLEQSFYDSQEDYSRSLTDPAAPHFDIVILTASNEHQAEIFRSKLETADLPAATEFVVIPDKNGERIGSGGATLSAVKYIKEKYGSFKNIRAAVLHSGGDGKRIPNYSAMGKIFSPVPRLLPSGKPSTLFDEIMISIAGIPRRIQEGMLVMSGDVLLLFNPLQIDFCGNGAGAFAFKDNIKTAVNHGVYVQGGNNNVARFLHKMDEEHLRQAGAVNESDNVSIDTGAVLLAPDILESLYSMVDTREKEDLYINPVTRLSFYADFLYPLAENSTLEEYYSEKPEGVFNDLLTDARTVLWQKLRKYRLQQINISPSKFIHFGTTEQVLKLMSGGYRDYSSLGWNGSVNSCVPEDVSAYNSISDTGAVIGNGTYLECSYIHGNSKTGKNCLISFADVDNKTIPDNVVLHCLKLLDGRFVCRIYGIGDNPKEDRLFGIPFSEIGFINAGSLWDAEIYPVCDSVSQAIDCALDLYARVTNNKDCSADYSSLEMKSLKSGFNESDPYALNQWMNRMDELVRIREIEALIDSQSPLKDIDFSAFDNRLTHLQQKWIDSRINELDLSKPAEFAKAVRLYRFTDFNNDIKDSKWINLISETVRNNVSIGNTFNKNHCVRNEATVSLPLRVNFGGGWSDTPPYCIENGGKVLNCAITIGDDYPVCVTIKRIPEKKIAFDSRDMNVSGEFTDIADLKDFGNPYDPFAIQKACLTVCGIITENTNSISDVLDKIGSGFEILFEVKNVPKGSGLGTSSILSAACTKALLDFFDVDYTIDDLYDYVLAVEQIMSTGGGWQDQVGGLTPGLKLISSNAGVRQKVSVEYLELKEETKEELSERFCLVYTGQRRLARNILRDVIDRYLSNDPECVKAYNEIPRTALKMKSSLEDGDIDGFAELMNKHFEMSIKINPETTNTLIDYIFKTAEDLIDGRFVCGAGGGGFLQVILKKGVKKKDLSNRLKSVFQDFPIDVWNCRLIF